MSGNLAFVIICCACLTCCTVGTAISDITHPGCTAATQEKSR